MTDNEIIEDFEKLTKYSGFTKKVEKLLHDVIDLINRKNAEIERLTANIKTFENIIKNYFLEKTGLNIDPLAEIKSEAVREFSDRLKEKAYPFPCAIGVENAVTIRTIDDLVKEMTEDTNA